MAEGKKEKTSYWWYLPQIIALFVTGGGCLLLALLRKLETQDLLQAVCFTVLGISILGLAVRRSYPYDPDHKTFDLLNLKRFWYCFFLFLCLAFVCVFLPNTSWPFMAVFVVLGLFSDRLIGLVGGSVLLMMTVLSSGGGAGIFFLYFVSGVFALIFFLPLKKDFHLVLPLSLSLGCLLVCEMSGIFLTRNSTLSLEQFLLPFANMVVTSLILLGGIRYYSSRVLYQIRDLYQYLNDTEHPALVKLRETDRKEYLQSIHTAYFCDRIGKKLNLDTDVLRCAGYYHRLCPTKAEEREAFYEEMNFPGEVRKVLNEYEDYMLRSKKYAIVSRESAILLSSQTVIMAVLALFEKSRESTPDIDRIVDAAFGKFEEHGTFLGSDIGFREYVIMKQTFKEDKLYYDFLR